MRIGILGAGRIGSTLAGHLANAGHEVALANSGNVEALRPLAASLGANVTPKTPEQAAAFGEIVIVTIPWVKRATLPPATAFAGKIVVDTLNPYTPDFTVADLGASTSSEEVAKQLPGARLVKAFNTLYFETLRTGAKPDAPMDERLTLFVAGDDTEAKRVVENIIEQIGFAPLDTGSLREGGRKQQPGSPIYNRPLTLEQARAELAKA